MARVLVTGGAGYIGSHMLLALKEAGHEALTYDNLSTGNRSAVLHGDFVEGDLGDKDRLRAVVRDFSPHSLIHFAASIEVGESVENPLKYYRNNTGNLINTLDAIVKEGVKKVVFSSTAAIYGIPEAGGEVSEESAKSPINPYGESKLMSEKVLKDLSLAAPDFNYVALRYFNVAGADPEGRVGQSYKNPTHLITRALKTAKGEFDKLTVFGNDYPTPDGTGIRDYIHVSDLCGAHLSALEWLAGKKSGAFNCGYGKGASVLEVLDVVRKVTGVDIPVEIGERRAGDPPMLVANSSLLKRETSWQPRYDDLEFIVKTAWEWERKR